MKKPKKKAASELDLENPVKKTLNKKPVVGAASNNDKPKSKNNDPKSKNRPPQKSKKKDKTDLDLDNPSGLKDIPKSQDGKNDRALSPEALQDAEMAQMFGDGNEIPDNNDNDNEIQEDLDQFQDPNESGIGTQESTIIPDNENHSDEPVIPEVDEDLESGDDLDETNIANNILTNVKEIRKGKF